MNNFFINFKNGYICLLHLLVVLLQMLNVPWSGESLSVHGFQVVTVFPWVMNDSVRSFLCGTQLSLGRVFSCCGGLAQDKVTYVQSSEFNPLIVVFGHLQLVLCHLAGGFVSYFVQTVQVKSQFIVIALFVKRLSPDACYSYFDRDYCFSAVSKPEGGFSCWGFRRGSLSPQDIW